METVWLVWVDHEDGRNARLHQVRRSRDGAEVAGVDAARAMDLLTEDGGLHGADFARGIIAEKGHTRITIEERRIWA